MSIHFWKDNGTASALASTFATARSILASPFFDFSAVNRVDYHNGTQSSLYKTIQHDSVLHALPWQALAKAYFCSLQRSILNLGDTNFLWHSLQMNSVKLQELKVPPRVISSLFLTHANAWCTNSRFGGTSRRCPICKADFTNDSIRHISECAFLKQLAYRFLRLCSVHDKIQFLVLAREMPTVVGRRALHIYASKRAYDTCRNSNRFGDFIKVYQAALISFYAKNQCKDLLCKTILFGTPPSFEEVSNSSRPVYVIAGSTQTVLEYYVRSSL